MKTYKKLGIVISIVAVGVMSVAVLVSAASNYNDVKSSYTQTFYNEKKYNNSKELDTLRNQCKVTNPANFYMDTYIQTMAQGYINSGYYVGDLRYLTEYGIYHLLCDNGLAFNYGFVAESKSKEPNITNYICKCSKADYSRLCDYYKISDESRHLYYFNTKSRSDGLTYEFIFDSNNLILKVKAHL